MERHEAELITSEYVKSIYGFSLKHCRSIDDAEDLSQEILLKIFRTLLMRDDIESTERFIWTIAHNTLCNYYRDTKPTLVGVPIYELVDCGKLLPPIEEQKKSLHTIIIKK